VGGSVASIPSSSVNIGFAGRGLVGSLKVRRRNVACSDGGLNSGRSNNDHSSFQKCMPSPTRARELMAALAEIITPARGHRGCVINLDIARDLARS